MGGDTPQSDDDTSERQFWGKTLRVVYTLLIVVALAGVLASLTVALHWTPYLLLSVIGLLAGVRLSLALLGSAHSRELTALVLGAVALPLLAAWLSGLAAASPDNLTAAGAPLLPFLAYAAATVCGGSAIARVWRPQPEHLRNPTEAARRLPNEGGAP